MTGRPASVVLPVTGRSVARLRRQPPHRPAAASPPGHGRPAACGRSTTATTGRPTVSPVATDRAAPSRPAPARLRPERAAQAALNPAQQSVRDQLGSAGGDPPDFPTDLGPALEADLAAGLAPLLDELGDGSVLIIAKHGLAQARRPPSRSSIAPTVHP